MGGFFTQDVQLSSTGASKGLLGGTVCSPHPTQKITRISAFFIPTLLAVSTAASLPDEARNEPLRESQTYGFLYCRSRRAGGSLNDATDDTDLRFGWNPLVEGENEVG